ncbi:MAG: hypothetical protein WBD36_13685 [Bacteroidota bacterium]
MNVLDKVLQAVRRTTGIGRRSDSDAEFLGWQKTPSGEQFALYNVTAEQHPLYRSTVSEQTLRRENLEIPSTPSPQGEQRPSNDERDNTQPQQT